MKRFEKLMMALVAGGLLALAMGCARDVSRTYDDQGMRWTGSLSHTLSGTVSEIDHESGVLTLVAEETIAELPFDSGTVAGIKEGDLVTAHIVVSRAGVEPRWRAYDAPDLGDASPPAVPADETLIGPVYASGTVEKIDHVTGTLAVRAEPRFLRIEFPPADIRHLRDGDEVTVWAKFTRGA